jgi:leucine dehydrogenase
VAEDVGITPDDLEVVARETTWVHRGGAGLADSVASTAYAAFIGIGVTVRRRIGRSDLQGVTVGVQGLGRVGSALCSHLAAAGARLVVTDLDPRKVDAAVRLLGARAVAPDAIADEVVDVLAPCALGDAINAHSAPRLRCAVVAGAANNQLADPGIADVLAARGILYAPDFVMNAGGALGAASGIGHQDDASVRRRLEALGPLLESVYARAEREGTSTHTAAERIARERLQALGGRP